MPKDPNISFSNLVNSIFGVVIHDYGFKYREENDRLIIATKGEMELVFRLESIPLFYYFSLEIRLLGGLAKQASSEIRYRGLGVSTIAECLDPNYKSRVKGAQTESDLRKLLETGKEELLKYCTNILLGDVSSWQKIVDCLHKKD